MEIERLPLGQYLADKHRAAELRWRGMPPGNRYRACRYRPAHGAAHLLPNLSPNL